MHINVQFDAFPGPPAFRNAVLTAAAMIGAALSDNITVNVWVGYGDFGVNGTTPLPSQSISEGNTTGGISVSYSQVRNLLIDHAAPGDATFNSLPAGATIQGQNQVAVWSAQEKALGLLAANNAAYDGFVGIGTNIPTSALVGAALHEIGHALGRLAYGPQPDIFDLFRFTSPGTRLFLLGNTAPAAYFSTDGGVTDLADYGQTSDASDFLGGALTPEDPFNEFYDSGTLQHLTLADLLQFDANGFNLNSSFNPSKVAFSPNDFGDDFGGDVLWRSTSGALAEWNVDGSFLAPANGSSYVTVNGAAVGPDASWSVAGISDFNDDGKADVLWRRSSGELALWTMNGTAVTNSKNVSLNGSIVAPDASWNVIDVGDFNGDGNSDILWRASSGATAVWFMNGPSITSSSSVVAGGTAVNPDPSWSVAGVGDFDNDRKTDILWRNSNGAVALWTMSGSNIVTSAMVTAGGVPVAPDASWTIAGVGDFNGDHQADILWRNNVTGSVGEWLMNGSTIISSGAVTTVNGTAIAPDASWHIVSINDFAGTTAGSQNLGSADIFWRNDSGAVAEWIMNGTQVWRSFSLDNPDSSWSVQNKPTNFA